ncbi:telomere repeat-binding protein 2-like isoform X2 [Impatiens glandulifera]|uniref:telomere repeat-binding protein 2-like isoform X2 n=1 Tax=Impatiens glandulifera TaxID=253017 RepID=UPI001FB18E41|nr:telomere repeat-binding protein 2-like isoform X2 [Impatiens glandulifera]
MLKKSLNYEFCGYQFPVIPRAPRSIRGKVSKKKSLGDGQICAFELLATVAGKLLLECESSASSNAERKKQCSFESLKVKQEDSNPGRTEYLENNVKLEIPKIQFENVSCYNVVDRGSALDNVIKKEHNPEVIIKPDLTATSVNNSNVSSLKNGNYVKVGCTDDNKKFVGFNGHSVKTRFFRPQSRFGFRRIRKLLMSKYWKAGPKLKDCDFTLTNGRSQHEGPSRKRKFYDHNKPTAGFECEGSSESISNSPGKSMKRGMNGSPIKLHIASGPSSVVRESHVNLSIKSFRVPDLYIEVPETATVGSLKRKVMEAVTSIIQDGLHVGVLLRGKKVRDDNRTLLQSGICDNSDLDALGFILEPQSAMEPPPVSPKDHTVLDDLVPSGTKHHEILGSILSPVVDTPFGGGPPLQTDVVKDMEVTDYSKALVTVPAMAMEDALSVVPINQKASGSEIVQRRTRRPFTVTEVEALVETVEKLGTGRWRDVKLSAFEDAEHRTYVDLKDKWKTLVHTANISPQQRRGEPVPQELLDRVLIAHAFWSHNQPKPLFVLEEHFKILET